MFTGMMTMMMIFAKYTCTKFPLIHSGIHQKNAHALKLSNSIIPSPSTYDPTGQLPPGGDPKTDA